MTLERPQITRQHVTIRDPNTKRSKTFTTYESTFDETVGRVTAAIVETVKQTSKTRRPKSRSDANGAQ